MAKPKLKNQDFSKIGTNITHLMEACGMDAAQLAQQTNLPASTISRLRSNTTDFSPNLSTLLPIAEFFRVTLSQLIGEEPINASVYGTFKPTKICKFPLPVLDAKTIQAFLTEQLAESSLTVDVDISVSEKSFAYVLQGNAMEPHFPDKTLLIIDPAVSFENLDHILVIPKGKMSPILRQVLVDGDEQYIRALNPAFNEFAKFDHSSHQVLGVMVQSRRNFKSVNQAEQHMLIVKGA